MQLKKQVRRRDGFFAAHNAFQMKLLHLAGKRWAAQVVTDLHRPMKLKDLHSLFNGRRSQSLREHRALLAAIRARQ